MEPGFAATGAFAAVGFDDLLSEGSVVLAGLLAFVHDDNLQKFSRGGGDNYYEEIIKRLPFATANFQLRVLSSFR